MSKVCDISGKRVQTGNAKKHQRGSSGGGGVWRFKAQKTKRTWKPNLRKVRLEKDGKVETYTIAMNIYKKLRQEGSYKGYNLVRSYVPASK